MEEKLMKNVIKAATFNVLDEDDPILDIFHSNSIAFTFKFYSPKGCSRWQPEDINEFLNLYAKRNNYRLVRIMDRVPRGSHPHSKLHQQVFWDDYFEYKSEVK